MVTYGSNLPVRDQIVAGIACRKCENSSRLCEDDATSDPTRLFHPEVVHILQVCAVRIVGRSWTVPMTE